MTPFAKNIIGTIIAAAICANVAALFNLSERVASIEALLRYQSQQTQALNYSHHEN